MLSAVPAEVEDPTTEAAEEPGTEDPGTEDDGSDDTEAEATELPVFIGAVSVAVVNGSVTITGQVLVPNGSSPTLTFGGVLSGLSATIGTDGSFTVTAPSSVSGFGTISLVEDDGIVNDFQTVVL